MPEFILDEAGEVTGTEFSDLRPFVQGYIKAMFWLSQSCIAMTEFHTPDAQHRIAEGQADGDLPQDAGFSDLHPDALHRIISDCDAFRKAAAPLLSMASARDYDEERAGHDFWLTRNGHGAGFWDRDELAADGLGNKLSDIARKAGEVNPYFGDEDDASPTGYGFVYHD